MVWFKVDDGLPASRKILSIPRAVRLSAVGLWTLAGAWSAGEELDGHVPDYMVTELGGTPRLVDALIRSGLWESVHEGAQFSKWAEYQPTRAELEAGRAKEADRKRRWRERQHPSSVPPGQDEGRDPESEYPDPTRPDPSSTKKNVEAERPDVNRICELLADRIEANGSKRPEIGKTWSDSARLMIDRDKRPLSEIVALIEWCQTDSFWKGNILSMPKFRDKYDQLRLQRESKTGGKADGPSWDKLRRLDDRR